MSLPIRSSRPRDAAADRPRDRGAARRAGARGVASLLVILWSWACGPGAPPAEEPPTLQAAPTEASAPAASAPPPPQGAPPLEQDLDQGQQHPPLPADNPAWDWDAGGFVSDFGWYGEGSWHDVRMRVVGHLAVIGWTRARAAAAQGDLGVAASRLETLVADLDAVPEPPAGPARALRALLRDAAERDARLLAALSKGQPLPSAEGLAGLRAEVLALSAQPSPSPAALRDVQDRLRPYLEPRSDLDLDAFADFEARHELRLALWAAWADSLDPLSQSPTWGYWEPVEVARQAAALGVAAGWLGGDDWAPVVAAHPSLSRAEEAQPLPPERWRWASHAATRLATPQSQPDFSAEELGRLPTGDSLIDVGGSPGPRAIGALQRLGLDDPEHRARLVAEAEALDRALEADAAMVARRVRALSAELDRAPHGSRYYNVKQARNAGVRQLARAGRADLALDLLADHWPLHHQDWACPNRAGILRALEGQLLLAAEQPGAAEGALTRARDESLSFLSFVAQAEAAPPGQGPGVRPPRMGPPRGGAPRGGSPGGAPGGGPQHSPPPKAPSPPQ